MIDIIVVTRNAKEKLKACLSSIKKYTTTVPYKLTVINNNSSDGTKAFLDRYHEWKLRIFHSRKNLGFSGAANIALKKTQSNFIALLDDDVRVTKNWLEGLYGEIKKSPSVGIVGPKVVYPDKKIFSAGIFIWKHIIFNIGSGYPDRGERDYVGPVDGLNGACWLIRRKLIGKVGYFDKRFFPCQWEDVDYCIRTRLAGYKIIYNGKVTVVHHSLLRTLGRNNRIKFIKKWPDLSMFPMARPKI